MEQEKIDIEVKKLRNLPQYKDKSKEFLEEIALASLKKREVDLWKTYKDPDENKLAKKIYNKYIQDYPDLNSDQIDILQDIIYEEICKSRTQTRIDKLEEDGKAPQGKLIEILRDHQDRIVQLKERLGINLDTDELSGWQMMMKRVDDNINEYRNEFEIDCKWCGKPLLLRKKITDFDILEHPFFAGKWLFNFEIFKDVKSGKLSKEDAWRYLSCARTGKDYKPPAFDKKYITDYINHCLKHWKEIIEYLETKEK